VNRLAQDIIANLRDQPYRWTATECRWVRDDGYSFWRGNGAASLSQIAPSMASLGGYFTKRAVWRAFKEWEFNMPLGGYRPIIPHVDFTASFGTSKGTDIRVINADTGQPFEHNPRKIIGDEECDMGCCSHPIYEGEK
jgi:hypothetical protein